MASPVGGSAHAQNQHESQTAVNTHDNETQTQNNDLHDLQTIQYTNGLPDHNVFISNANFLLLTYSADLG